MIFRMEKGIRIKNVRKNDIEKYLAKIDGYSNSFAIIEKEDSSYMQVGGGPTVFTVEARKYYSSDEFIHKKAKQKNNTNIEECQISISGSPVTILKNQVMNLKSVTLLFKSFFEGEDFPSNTDWDDITAMFI